MSIFKGSATALITPFLEDGINFDALADIIENQIECNTDALVVCGTTGEASTMTHDEKIETIKFAKNQIKNRVPLIIGTGSNDTKNVINLNNEVEEIGVDALLVVTPYYNKCTQNGLIEHYSTIAQNTSLPIIMYNVPSRTGVNLLPETAARIYTENENIIAIKEASGNIDQIAKLASISDIDIYSGNDSQILPIMSLGGKGVISVLSNILPYDTHMIVKNYLDKRFDEAMTLQLKYFKLIELLFKEVNPIPIKEAMNLMGFNAGSVRMPLTKMQEENLKLLKDEMKNLRIIL